MAGVLITASTIMCRHGATITASSSAKLTASGSAVLVGSGVTAWSLSSSCIQQPTQAQPNNVACSFMTGQSGGQSQKLTAGGSAVVLDSITGSTNGKPQSDVTVAAVGQSRLTAT
jgi:hypothetical protein